MTRSPRLRAFTTLTLLGLMSGLPAQANDTRIDTYVAEALRNNPLLEAEAQASIASEYALDAARAQRLPSLALSARYSMARGGRTIDFPSGDLLNPVYATLNQMLEQQGEPPAFPSIDNVSIPLLRRREQDTRLSLTAPLYAPEISAGIDARRALLESAHARYEATARVLVREVKRAYYGAAQADAAVEILGASEALLSEDVRVAESLVREGSATQDRALRARAEQLAVAQRLDATRASANAARRQFNALLDRDADADIELPSVDNAQVPASAVDTPAIRPELRQLERAAEAADASTRAAQARRLPELALGADYGIEGERYRFRREDDFAIVSLVLRWNLFDFGGRRAAVAGAAAEANQLRAERRNLERQLDLALRTARDDLATAQRAIATAEARLKAADASFRIAERKRAEASLSHVEFLDAERALTEARLNLAIARFTFLDQLAELELATATYPLPADTLAGGMRE
jgi:outer membrane protein TolC